MLSLWRRRLGACLRVTRRTGQACLAAARAKKADRAPAARRFSCGARQDHFCIRKRAPAAGSLARDELALAACGAAAVLVDTYAYATACPQCLLLSAVQASASHAEGDRCTLTASQPLCQRRKPTPAPCGFSRARDRQLHRGAGRVAHRHRLGRAENKARTEMSRTQRGHAYLALPPSCGAGMPWPKEATRRLNTGSLQEGQTAIAPSLR